MLEEECVRAEVRVKLSTQVKTVRGGERSEDRSGDRNPGQFTAVTEDHEFCCNALVVATGGLSIPKMGATSFGYDLAQQFGLKLVEPRPASGGLHPESCGYETILRLGGDSTEVVASIGKQSFRENLLITH